MAEEAPTEAAWTVHTDVFDGPLDLLLYLVRRDGIDLRRLDVRQVTDSYLEYLDRMRVLNLSLAGDYLVMAATLVHLKSLELLPRLPTIVEEEEDPREALARQIRDYAKVRARADALDTQPRVGRDVFVRDAADVDDEDRVVAGLDAFALLDIYWELLQRAEEPEPVVELLHPSGVDFRSCCATILSVLGGKGGRGELTGLLKNLRTRPERVVTFVAALEMARQQWVAVSQERHLGPVELEQLKETDAIDLDMLAGWVDTDGDGELLPPELDGAGA